jgi:ESCRT-II complex subunit VPS25
MAVQRVYDYPPIYNFAPFFTLQRNPATLSSQLKLWTRFVLDYCQHHRIFVLNLDGAWEKSGAGGLFRNETIKRELDKDARTEVLKALVEEGES